MASFDLSGSIGPLRIMANADFQVGGHKEHLLQHLGLLPHPMSGIQLPFIIEPDLHP